MPRPDPVIKAMPVMLNPIADSARYHPRPPTTPAQEAAQLGRSLMLGPVDLWSREGVPRDQSASSSPRADDGQGALPRPASSSASEKRRVSGPRAASGW